jgi:hypothetical protein
LIKALGSFIVIRIDFQSLTQNLDLSILLLNSETQQVPGMIHLGIFSQQFNERFPRGGFVSLMDKFSSSLQGIHALKLQTFSLK